MGLHAKNGIFDQPFFCVNLGKIKLRRHENMVWLLTAYNCLKLCQAWVPCSKVNYYKKVQVVYNLHTEHVQSTHQEVYYINGSLVQNDRWTLQFPANFPTVIIKPSKESKPSSSKANKMLKNILSYNSLHFDCLFLSLRAFEGLAYIVLDFEGLGFIFDYLWLILMKAYFLSNAYLCIHKLTTNKNVFEGLELVWLSSRRSSKDYRLLHCK